MSEPALTERQLALAAASAEVAARSRAAAASRGEAGWAAGDRVLATATRHLPVEWIVLEAEGGRYLAVPADTCPLVADTDLALPAGAAAGALTLRCGFPVWLDAGQIGRRAGAIDQVTLEAARRRLAAARTGAETRAEAGTVPEYRAWIREVIAPAVAAVELPAAAPRREPPARRGSRHPALAAAASLAMVLAGALLAWLAWPRPSPKVAALPGASALPPAAHLYPNDTLRGERPPVRMPVRAAHLEIVLDLNDLNEYPAYRVVLLRQDGAAIWQQDGLRSRDRSLHLVLPSQLLQTGTYNFRLSGLHGARAVRLGEYELVIDRPNAAARAETPDQKP